MNYRVRWWGSGFGSGPPSFGFQWSTLLQIFLALITVLGEMVENVEGLHANVMCVQLGQAHSNKFGYPYHYQYKTGPFTIGARKFDIIRTFLDQFYYEAHNSRTDIFDESDTMNTPCPYSISRYYETQQRPLKAEPCVNDSTVELRTYAVKQNGKVMQGWLHFEIELKDMDDEILAIYIQVQDEYFNAIGEFVSDSDAQCPPSDNKLVQPSKYQILPCSAIGYREAKNSNGIFMAEKTMFRNLTLAGPYIPKGSISRGVHFTWRLSEYWCNRHLRFRPVATIFTQKHMDKKVDENNELGTILFGDPLVYRKTTNYWFRPRWFGAADIKLSKTTLSCTEKIIDYSTGKVDMNLAPWLDEKGVLGVLGIDYFSMYQIERDCWTYPCEKTLKSCQVNTITMYTLENSHKAFGRLTVPTFGGRCTHHYEKEPRHNASHGCNLDENNDAPEFEGVRNFPIYAQMVQDLTKNRTGYCGFACHVPNQTNLNDIKSFNDTSGEFSYFEIINYNADRTRNRSKIEKMAVGRKYHASLCILWTMFLTPLGIFCARYFKETCMSVTCSGAHFWFWVHLAATLMSASVFISSLTGIWANMENWGRNIDPAGTGHRIVGYLSVTLFFLMIILGGIRPLEKKMRIIIMTSHSIVGFLIYFFNYLAMLLSFNIPGSPTIGQCDEMGFTTQMSSAIIPMLLWVFMDATMHIAMTVMQLMKDRSVDLRRPWYCPIIPILPHDSADDFIGSSIRKITLLVYGGASFIMTFATIGLINRDDSPPEICRHRTGHLSCKELWGCSATSMAYSFKVSATSNTSGRYVFGEFP